MQVSVESVSNLERRIMVDVPAERIDSEVESRLKSMVGRVRIDGFRPGKVPLTVLRQRYGQGVFREVLGEVMQRTFVEAVAKENLRPAGMPRFDNIDVKPGQTLRYTAQFEIYPEVELADLGAVEISVPNVEIQDADVDAMIEKLRQQNESWDAVERAAESGDQVVIDFEGFRDGVAFDGGKAQDYPLVIGGGRFIEGFEPQLIGACAGEERTVSVTFPENYPAKELAGQAAEFKVKVKVVKARKLPEVDAEFARLFGIEDGSIEKFRDEVRANMQRELDQSIRGRVKNQVMDALEKLHGFDIPQVLIAEEIRRLREQAQASMRQPTGATLPDDIFRDQARKRVLLGLVIGEIIKRNGITLDRDRVSKTLDSLAATYENPQEVIEYYRKHRDQMAALEAMVLEDQVVDWVKEQAKVTLRTMSFNELTSPTKQEVAA